MERRNLEVKVGAHTIENICDVILSSEENWNSVAGYTEALLKFQILLRNLNADMDMKGPNGLHEIIPRQFRSGKKEFRRGEGYSVLGPHTRRM